MCYCKTTAIYFYTLKTLISKTVWFPSNKISNDLVLNISCGSKGFSLTYTNMYILHVHLYVKEYVITFSIILKVKIPTFSSFLEGSQTRLRWSMLMSEFPFLKKCRCYNVLVSRLTSTRVWWPMPETNYHQQRMLYSWFGY